MFKVFFILLSLLSYLKVEGKPKAGVSILAGGDLSGISLNVDTSPVSNKVNFTLGGEFIKGLGSDLYALGIRMYFWERSNLSGFYGGPNVYSLFNEKTGAVGAEAGWFYTFPVGVSTGLGLNVWDAFSEKSRSLQVKFSAGYKF